MKLEQYTIIRTRAELLSKKFNVGFDKVMHNVTSDDDYYIAFKMVERNASLQTAKNKLMLDATITQKHIPEFREPCDQCDGKGNKKHFRPDALGNWVDVVCYKCEGKGYN